MHPSRKTDKKEKEKDHTAGPRVIRTFQEIKVPTVVNAEEWYEELECGICAHILGGTQAIVPCGHSFCGPCVWQWTRVNKQPSCPHCRVAVSEIIPFVPNIMVDQIIDRKLGALPDSADKRAMEVERSEKIEAWKVIQASIAPPKPIQKRARGLDEIIATALEMGGTGTGPSWRAGHARRASRNVMELGVPIHPPILPPIQSTESAARPPLPHHNTITDLARMRDERLQEQVADLRRVRDQRLRNMGDYDNTFRLGVPVYGGNGNNPGRSNPSRSLSQSEAQGVRPPRTSDNNPHSMRQQAPGRDGAIRSAALVRRQARGQSRDDALVVLSDSE